MNKNKIVKSILVIIVLLIILRLLFIFIPILATNKESEEIADYNKDKILLLYESDLNSNLSIFPDDLESLLDSHYVLSLTQNLFTTDGYIILMTKYDEKTFATEVKRLQKLNMLILENCKPNSHTYTNYVKYSTTDYSLPAYITIDGFANKYEYALIDEKEYKIYYIYLSSPNINEEIYKKYLKKDKSCYSDTNTLAAYSMYNHTFDNGASYAEYNDCTY